MSTETVITKPGRARKSLAITLGLALVAVAGGAATNALWQDQHTSDPTVITLGSFELKQTDYRVSMNGMIMDPMTTKAAPGDTVRLEYDYLVTSDAQNVVELATDYVPSYSTQFAGGTGDTSVAQGEPYSWTTPDVTGATVVNQGLEGAPYKVTLTGGQATFTASTTITIPDTLDNTWTNAEITHLGTMYVSQGDTVEAEQPFYVVKKTEAAVTASGAAQWPGLVEGDAVTLTQHSDGTVQILQQKPAPDYYVEFFTEDTIDNLLAAGYFTTN